MKSEESDDYINFTDFITLNLIGIRVPLYACVCVCVYGCFKTPESFVGICDASHSSFIGRPRTG